MARGKTKSAKKRNKGLSYVKFGYLFIAPFVIVYTIFSFYPLLTTFWYSGSNMTSTKAKFWGFDHQEAYYDQFLDLSEFYGDDFEEQVGITKMEYLTLRYYFQAQTSALENDPLSGKGIKALQEAIDQGKLEGVSADTCAKLNQAIAEKNLALLDNDALKELKDWRSNYVDDTLTITNQLMRISTNLKLLANPEIEDEEDSSDEEAITAASIIESDDFTAFIETLKTEEFSDGTVMLMDYLAKAVGYEDLVTYFTDVQNGSVAVEDSSFYFVCTNLNSPKAVDAEGESIDGVSVPFLSKVKTYLSTSEWPNFITSLNTYEKLNDYANRKIDLHNGEEDLLADLTTLYESGLINNVQLVEEGGKLVQAQDKSQNIIYAMKAYIDENYQSDATLSFSSSQLSKIDAYLQNQGRGMLVALGYDNVDTYIEFSDSLEESDINIDKYLQFKTDIGLLDVLTYDKYLELDANFKAARVEEASAKLAEAEAALPEAQAAFDAVAGQEGTDEYEAANNALIAANIEIERQTDKVNNPKGLLQQVNAKAKYVFVGTENFNKIFTNKTRFNSVFGSFANTAILWILGVIPQILLALILSAWFTDTKIKLKGLNLMKALMYLPNVITAVTVAIFFRRVFAYSTGASRSASQLVLEMFGHPEGYNFFASAWATRFIIAFINFWMWYGNTMITLIAGISAISESLYESAQIDGANTFQTYTLITLPLLRPILLYTMVTSLIGGLQMFDIPQNINVNPALINFNGSMIRSTRTVLMYINQQAFGMQDLKQVGIASAVSILLFFTTTILSVIIFYLMRDKDAIKAQQAKKKAKKEAALKNG
ncbi:MAG: ABC transporter permease subunit [Clostridia bacterium]|nr:ABC transporter permease subunit [Clostridia bacterium]